jgi:hypothetical protein
MGTKAAHVDPEVQVGTLHELSAKNPTYLAG